MPSGACVAFSSGFEIRRSLPTHQVLMTSPSHSTSSLSGLPSMILSLSTETKGERLDYIQLCPRLQQ